MITSFILFIVVTMYDYTDQAVAVATQEFSSEAACKEARLEFLKVRSESLHIKMAKCVKK